MMVDMKEVVASLSVCLSKAINKDLRRWINICLSPGSLTITSDLFSKSLQLIGPGRHDSLSGKIKLGPAVDRVAIKWFMKVRISLSAAF